DRVQAQLLATRPYWTTPIAPLLDDAVHLFENDSRLRPWNATTSTGDPYSDCRTRAVVLLADGEPSVAYWSSFYPTTLAAAVTLYSKGIKVYVVGFQASSEALVALQSIAAAGGTDAVYVADDQAQLAAILGAIFLEIRGSQPSRSRSAITNRTLSFEDLQYQVFGSYAGSSSPLDDAGRLDQYIYRCDPACRPNHWEAGDGASLCEIFSIDAALNQRTTPRRVLTQLGGILTEVTIGNQLITANLLGIPTTGSLPRLDPLDLNNGLKVYTGMTLGSATSPSVRALYREQLLRLLRADPGSRREDARLGAIFHSDPVFQPDLFSMSVPVPSYNAYRLLEGVVDRPTVFFIGTHEGMLHAFRVDRIEGLQEAHFGEELWAFIPKHLLGMADALADGMVYLMDGDPVVREIRLHKTQGELESADFSLEEEAERWRSVLVTGYGSGGRGYVALDVTRPGEPGFLWEVSNTEHCYRLEEGTSACDPSDAFALLGTSESAPAVGTLFLSWKGVYQERGVAVFGAGGAVADEKDSGKAVYVVDLATGTLLREFCNDSRCGSPIVDTSDAPSNDPGLDCPMDGNVMGFDESPGSILTRAFIGDRCGQLWRLDLGATDPAEWTLTFFYDAYDGVQINKPWQARRRPLKLRPASSIGPGGELILIAGTGDPDVSSTQWLPDRVFSLAERWDTTTDTYGAFANWNHAFEDGEAFTGEPLVFDKVAYFTSVAPAATGACAVGEGRLWGVHYMGYDPDEIDDLEPLLDVNPSEAAVTLARYESYPGMELFGLQLIQRPACIDSAFDYAPWLGNGGAGAEVPPAGTLPPASPGGATFGGSSGGALQVVVQTGEVGASDGELQAPGGGGVSGTGTKKVMDLAPPAQSVFSASWGLLFD
ncbi:MAG: hypothetical protein FJ098_11030, partial [Deltaproteobacteria bacterium]|nr:hypothetical protein [Deltaproteobacteria bacterium]